MGGKVMPLEWVLKQASKLGINLANPKLFGRRIRQKVRKDPEFIKRVIANRDAVMNPDRYDYPLEFPCVGACLDENGKPVWVNSVKQDFTQNDYLNFLKRRYGEESVQRIMDDPVFYAGDDDTREELRVFASSIVSDVPLEMKTPVRDHRFEIVGDNGTFRKFAKVHGNGDVEFQKVAPSQLFNYSYSNRKDKTKEGFEGYISKKGDTLGSWQVKNANADMRYSLRWNNSYEYPDYMWMRRPEEITEGKNGYKYVSNYGGSWVNPSSMSKEDLDLIRNKSYDWKDQDKHAVLGGWSSFSTDLGSWNRNISAKKKHDLNKLAPFGREAIVRKSREFRPESAQQEKYTDTGDKYRRYFSDTWFMKEAKRKADDIRSEKATAELEAQKKAIEAEIEKLKKKMEKKIQQLNATDSLSKNVGESVWKYPNLH